VNCEIYLKKWLSLPFLVHIHLFLRKKFIKKESNYSVIKGGVAKEEVRR
jgi:hypothetical protein